MTREEAIAIISKYDALDCGVCHQGGDEIIEAFNMAIKALEQEPCEDCVSRANLISRLEILERRYGSDFYWETRKIVDKLPSVKPQEPKTGHWIKYGKLYQCSECKELSCCQGKFCNECGARMVKSQGRSE